MSLDQAPQGDVMSVNAMSPPPPTPPAQTPPSDKGPEDSVSLPKNTTMEILAGDSWANGERSFRVDSVSDGGGASIRFRVEEMPTSAISLWRRMIETFQKKETLTPDGEWLFGSLAELQSFIAENGYRLEHRGKKKEARTPTSIPTLAPTPAPATPSPVIPSPTPVPTQAPLSTTSPLLGGAETSSLTGMQVPHSQGTPQQATGPSQEKPTNLG